MLTFTSKGRPRRRSSSSRLQDQAQTIAGPGDPDDSRLPEDAIERKGWHDSSMDLRRGLDVTEDLSVDTLPADLRPGVARRR